MGYSVPRVQSAPVFSIASYPQPYPQVRPVRADTLRRSDRSPPIAELQVWERGTPQQNIFPKVRSPNMALTCGYIYCDATHILKTRNALNFLPYI